MNKNLLKCTMAAGALVIAVGNGLAQDATTDPPQLSYGVSQIVQLSKANISEDTIISYVQNSGNSYNLDANQIIYLKGQGVSANVINVMIGQRNRPVASVPAPETPTPAPQPDYAVATAAPAPVATTYVPSSTVYVIPDTQTYNYDANYAPYYSGYYGWPAVSIGFGWGGGWGGYHGGWRGGGGWHGGGGGFHGGGWRR
jgi:hypothetical protein